VLYIVVIVNYFGYNYTVVKFDIVTGLFWIIFFNFAFEKI